MTDPLRIFVGGTVTHPDTSTTDSTSWALLEPPAWHARAACKGMDTSLFYTMTDVVPPAIKQLCESCPVRQQCLQAAIEHHELGVWGGLSTSDRARHKVGTSRTCIVCQRTLPIGRFRVTHDSVRHMCRTCDNSRSRARAGQLQQCPACEQVLPFAMFRGPSGGQTTHCVDCHGVRHRCTACGEVFPIDRFPPATGGWRKRCRQCQAAHRRASA